VAARVLTEEGHDGQTYTLTGPAAISFHDVARILSGILGREVSYLSVSLEKAKETMLARGLSEWLADTLTEYANAHSAGYSDWTTDDVERLTDHRATPYQQFAKDFAMVFLGGRQPTNRPTRTCGHCHRQTTSRQRTHTLVTLAATQQAYHQLLFIDRHDLSAFVAGPTWRGLAAGAVACRRLGLACPR